MFRYDHSALSNAELLGDTVRAGCRYEYWIRNMTELRRAVRITTHILWAFHLPQSEIRHLKRMHPFCRQCYCVPAESSQQAAFLPYRSWASVVCGLSFANGIPSDARTTPCNSLIRVLMLISNTYAVRTHGWSTVILVIIYSATHLNVFIVITANRPDLGDQAENLISTSNAPTLKLLSGIRT